MLWLLGVLDLPHVGPVFGDLVREPAGRNRICLCTTLGPLAAYRYRRAPGDVHHSLFRIVGRRAEKVAGYPGLLRNREPGGTMAGAIPAGNALDHATPRSNLSAARAGFHARLSRALSTLLQFVRTDFP